MLGHCENHAELTHRQPVVHSLLETDNCWVGSVNSSQGGRELERALRWMSMIAFTCIDAGITNTGRDELLQDNILALLLLRPLFQGCVS